MLPWIGGDMAFNAGPAQWSDQAAERTLGPADTPNNKAWTDQMNLAHSGLDTVFTGAQFTPNPLIMAGGYLGEYGQKLVRQWVN
ncbi:hypothetical protein, partial [Escherichia coli]|uniref:hypothetical protein n=1 Tax=Escherichia coli TaxID=562 RepID=UPI00127F6CBE